MYHLVLQKQHIKMFHLVLQEFRVRLALACSEIVNVTLLS